MKSRRSRRKRTKRRWLELSTSYSQSYPQVFHEMRTPHERNKPRSWGIFIACIMQKARHSLMAEEQAQSEKKQRKQRRRGHGEGSIFQRQRDGKWIAQLTLENGRTKQFCRKSYQEALRALQQAQLEQKQGRLARGPKQTVGQYLEYWLDIHQAQLKLSTYTMYRRNLDKHILPGIGHYQVQALTADQVQAFYAKKQKEGLSAASVRLLHAILSAAFKDAVRWKRLAYNICTAVDPPRLPRHERRPLDRDQAQRLLAVAEGTRLECLLTLALATGMRLGELLALRWGDINLEEMTLQVQHTVDHLSGRGFVETEPKTESSRRTIALPQFVVDALKQYRTAQLEMRLQAGARWKEQGLVFPNGLGKYLGRDRVYGLFKQLLHEAGLPDIRFHDLRHSAATLLLSMGVNVKVVQEILGHADIHMTLGIYGHVLPSMQRHAMDTMDDLFRGKKPGG